VPFQEPEVTDEEFEKELAQLREQHASFKNLDPRPLVDGDIAVVSLKHERSSWRSQIDQDETPSRSAAKRRCRTSPTNLRGKSPGDELDFEVNYPDDFGNEKLAGKTIPFHAVVKGCASRSCPSSTDEFAADVGDFQTIDELREKIREEINATSGATRPSRLRTSSSTCWSRSTTSPPRICW
jgi:trigger factor